MQYKLVIEGRLPALNEYIKNSNTHRCQGNNLKKETEDIISAYILQQLRRVSITKPVRIDYTWYEQNKKRDLDNVSSFGRKCIQDALVNSRVLFNDGWKQIVGFSDLFYVDKDHPRIEVLITEIEGGV